MRIRFKCIIKKKKKTVPHIDSSQDVIYFDFLMMLTLNYVNDMLWTSFVDALKAVFFYLP